MLTLPPHAACDGYAMRCVHYNMPASAAHPDPETGQKNGLVRIPEYRADEIPAKFRRHSAFPRL